VEKTGPALKGEPSPAASRAGAGGDITTSMTVREVVATYRATKDVFWRYDDRAGECLLCRVLFDPLDRMAAPYGLDLDGLLPELQRAAEIDEAGDWPTENDRQGS